jgi:hypothetical protein
MTADNAVTTISPTLVADRIARLRELSERDPAAAASESWAWIVELGHRLHRHRDEAKAELAELFRAGTPSETIDGPTEGILVSFAVHPLVDRALATITQAWMPWAGKRFDALQRRGDNLLAPSARWPSKLPWPRYRMVTTPLGLVAFDFTTWVEPGALDPDRDVLVIDYHGVSRNPRLIIKQIRDELVEIVPGTYLGKMLWRQGGGRHFLLAYFALRTPVGG